MSHPQRKNNGENVHYYFPLFVHFNIDIYIYHENGKEALFEERRGGASKMRIKKTQKVKKQTDVNKDLLAEVQRLRMENEYLKKLNALVQERIKRENKKK